MSESQAPESRPPGPRSPGPRAPEPRTPEPRTPELFSRTALAVFHLNGQFLSVAERLAQPAGLTAAWWQVLGAVMAEPLPVAGIARAMGITRQSVQRIADLLVERGLAAYRPNPAHRRAKLLAPTEEGRAALARITPGHAEFAARLGEQLGGPEDFRQVMTALERLSDALEELSGARQEPPGIREEPPRARETPPPAES